jgi:hypothetical protein
MTAGAGRPDLKMKRAGAFAEELRRAILEYRDSGSFWVDQKLDSAAGTVTLTLRVKTPAPLDDWSLIFGDCVHNLRSALDHLAWQLDAKPAASTAFPIRLNPPDRWPLDCVSRMRPDAQIIIEGLQPFWETHHGREPARHPLWALHSLDIEDKHKVLVSTASFMGGDSIIGLPMEASIDHLIGNPFADGSPMATIRFPQGKITPISCSAHFQVVLAAEPWKAADVLWMLDALLLGWIPEHVVEPLLPYARV